MSGASQRTHGPGTPYKEKTAGSKVGRMEYVPPKSAKDAQNGLAFEVGPYQHDNISVYNFATHILGLDPEICQKILAMPLTLDPMKVSQYVRLASENQLHAPFQEFAEALLDDVTSGLGVSADLLTDAFWDAKGNKEIKHDGRGRKPDMVTLWKAQLPTTANGVPKWTTVKHVLEFKHNHKQRGPSLPTLPAKDRKHILDTFNTGSRGGPKPKEKARLVNSETKAVSAAASSSNTNGKRNQESNSSFENGPESKRTRLETKKTQLGTYVIECMAATSRRWVVGMIVDTTFVIPCYYDRFTVVCATTFRFDHSPAKLALLLYAMNLCDKERAGFDPHLLPRLSDPTPDAPEDGVDVSLPVSNMIGSYFEFLPADEIKGDGGENRSEGTKEIDESKDGESTGADEEAKGIRSTPGGGEYKGVEESKNRQEELEGTAIENGEQPNKDQESGCFQIVSVVRKPDDLISRGTTVFKVRRRLPNGKFSDDFYALKLSWPLGSRVSEIAIIQHLKNVLPASSHDHLPHLIFSKTWTAEDLKLPWLKLGLSLNDENHQERVLRGLAAKYYRKLWEAGSIDNFKQAWLDCVEFCYLAYRIGGVMHRDLSENNLMVLPLPDGKVKGVLNDWDMAKFVQDQLDCVLAGHHRTGTPPFMALDLLNAIAEMGIHGDETRLAPPHWLRHDLESLFYILIWAAFHYNLGEGTRDDEVNPAVVGWTMEVTTNAWTKMTFLDGRTSAVNSILKKVKPEFKGVAEAWIAPLRELFKAARLVSNNKDEDEDEDYDPSTCDGVLTFKTFMDAIKVVPRTWGYPEDFYLGL